MTPIEEQQMKLMEVQIALYHRQNRWETPKALAMILLAVAALSATSHLVDFLMPPRPQTISVHVDAPLFPPR